MVKRCTGPHEDAEVDQHLARTVKLIYVTVAVLLACIALLAVSNG